MVGCAAAAASPTVETAGSAPSDPMLPVSGSAWEPVLRKQIEQSMRITAFHDALFGVTGGPSEDGKAFYTVDGGQSWTQASSSAECLFGLELVDAQVVWQCSSGPVRVSTDGAHTWQPVSDFGNFCRQLSFLDASTGWIAGMDQLSRLCTMGAVRDVYLMGNMGLMSGVIGLLAAAFMANLLLGQVHFGFADQPAVQGQHFWNFLGMVLVGLASALASGCPTRQLILAGEGQGDSATFLLGMVSGAAVAHNFGMVKPCVTGPMPVTVYPAGMAAVIAGLVVCLLLGLSMRHADTIKA